MSNEVRTFDTGATRDANHDKLDYEGFDSPLVTKRYAQYMHLHRHQSDGSLRAADNWQKGIPKQAYMESLVRHVEDAKLHWDGYADEAVDPNFENVLCAILFNAKGLLFELIRDRRAARSEQKASDGRNAQIQYAPPEPSFGDLLAEVRKTGDEFPNYGKFRAGVR